MTPYGKSVVASAIGVVIGLCVVVAVVYVAKQFSISEGEEHFSTSPAVEIEAARQRWLSNAPRAYSFEYRLDCFCPDAMTWWRVVVADGKVVGSSVVDASQARRRTETPSRVHPTIDAIFADLAHAAANNPARLSVEFDQTFYYPRSAFVDPIGTAVDDEWAINIQRFAPAESAEIEIAKSEEKQRIQNERPKPSPSRLMQMASDLERGGKGDEARKAYVAAARSGSCEAAARLGDIYGQGLGGIRPNYTEATKWYNAARVLGCDMPAEKRRQ